MLNIKILGPGCANCYILEGLTVATLEFMAENGTSELDLEDVTLQHLTQPQDFRQYNLLFTPGLVVNDRLVCAGRLPSALEVREWFVEALDQDTSPGHPNADSF
jgi:hypothetical protein